MTLISFLLKTIHGPRRLFCRTRREQRVSGITRVLFLAAVVIGATVVESNADTPTAASSQAVAAAEAPLPPETAAAAVTTIIETYAAVGTVIPLSEISIESQVGAQVKTVHVQAGDQVQKGDRLITLDNRQATSRLDGARQALKKAEANKQQARQAVTAAHAVFKAAELNFKRIQKYYASQAATQQELETAESGYVQARAGLARAEQVFTASEAGIRQAEETVSETRVALGFSQIDAPATGEVIKRMVEPGDMALPGRPLMSLRTAAGFQLAAHVREGLIHKIKPDMTLTADITSLDTTCTARVAQIIPYADPATRTFLVKAVLPHLAGLYPGMYGKLRIPETEQQVVQIPLKALIRTGQLEQVEIRQKDKWRRVYVKSGRRTGTMVEILSGLDGGEIVKISGVNLP